MQFQIWGLNGDNPVHLGVHSLQIFNGYLEHSLEPPTKLCSIAARYNIITSSFMLSLPKWKHMTTDNRPISQRQLNILGRIFLIYFRSLVLCAEVYRQNCTALMKQWPKTIHCNYGCNEILSIVAPPIYFGKIKSHWANSHVDSFRSSPHLIFTMSQVSQRTHGSKIIDWF